ncbi:stage II sporulation protein R [Lentibacillus cibarius]|uniref:Stage II sporulation protein R n=1 Tax=Lentibacillus cibarius TaxID=2583219 RepID=A0A5S3QLB6_9BACI|nr:stage II sporulation protein R [Lentibacillus cibarius]TMN22011.1 stage II sporulation protein R [Lentibacillus cibarius]
MRKITVAIIIFFILLFSLPLVSTSEEMESDAQSDVEVIPDEAIRLRILANSDKQDDQQLKRKVRDEVNAAITEWVGDITNIEQARTMIENRTPEIKKIVGDVLKEENKEQSYNVEYGKNVTFPAKLYGSYLYPAGEYEAVLITLGKGKGANWWCVLFPPLCFLDFSNGTSVAEAEEKDENKADEREDKEDKAEVKFFLFEWFDWS